MMNNFEFFQPWSSFVMKTKIPSDVLERMLSVTDTICSDENSSSFGRYLAGQIKRELIINIELLDKNTIDFFL